MKKPIYLLLLFIGFSCQSDPETINETPENNNEIETPKENNPKEPEEWIDTNLTRTETEMVKSGNEFSIRLFKEINKNEGNKNLFISPLSASMALSMVTNGAAGTTLLELQDALGFKSFTLEETNTYYRKMIRLLRDSDEDIITTVANSIWVNQHFPILESFKETNQKYLDAEVANLDFSNPDAKNIINQWCEDKTNGRIKDMLNSTDESQLLFLLNTIYFNAPWQERFFEELTKEDIFKNFDGTQSKVNMMNLTRSINYLEEDNIRFTELFYGTSASFSMVILLPEGNNTPQTIIDNLTPEKWNKWNENLKRGHFVHISLPKFKIEYERALNDDLQAIGIKEAFNVASANFSALSS